MSAGQNRGKYITLVGKEDKGKGTGSSFGTPKAKARKKGVGFCLLYRCGPNTWRKAMRVINGGERVVDRTIEKGTGGADIFR
ncbi:putative signal-induced proliferation-associated 1-like protein [Sesbania bispinosa]|nr:putative signal-induced proliferation-associated 1-like protein [Sesbania bispinosa]